MVINPPNHQTINVVAKVIWSTVISAAEGPTGFGVGVEFIRISETDREFLAKPLE
jgi:hypothetical protein